MFDRLQTGVHSPGHKKILGIPRGAAGMDKKIIVFLWLLTGLFGAEVGQFTRLSGETVISRNREPHFQPVVASRVYAGDVVLLNDMSLAVIETPQNIWQIYGPAEVAIHSADDFSAKYGRLSMQPKPLKDKNVFLAVAESVIFPGWGHWYLEDRAKALPLLGATSLLLLGISTTNPELSSEPEKISELRENYLQIYLVYMLIAAIDAWSEANAINRRIAENKAMLEN
jgi:hypothetical protein